MASPTIWYLCTRRALKPRSDWTVSLDEHLVWMREQHVAGRILVSGPLTNRTMSLYVIRAESLAQAQEIAAADPFTAAGFCSAEVLEWEIHQIMGVGPFSTAEQRLMEGASATDPLVQRGR